MSTLAALNRKMSDADALHSKERARILETKVALVRRFAITCVHCRAGSTLARWSFVQDYWYTSPSGCTEGDYWNTTKTECCYVACPLCGVLNYIYNHPQKAQILERIDDPSVSKEKLFLEIWKKHGNSPLKKVFPK